MTNSLTKRQEDKRKRRHGLSKFVEGDKKLYKGQIEIRVKYYEGTRFTENTPEGSRGNQTEEQKRKTELRKKEMDARSVK